MIKLSKEIIKTYPIILHKDSYGVFYTVAALVYKHYMRINLLINHCLLVKYILIVKD